MRVVADKAKCQGHAMCNAVSDRLFPIDDMGYVDIDTIEVQASDADLAQAAVSACPEQALRIVE